MPCMNLYYRFFTLIIKLSVIGDTHYAWHDTDISDVGYDRRYVIYVYMPGKGFSESCSDNFVSSGSTENPFPVLCVFMVLHGFDGYFCLYRVNYI